MKRTSFTILATCLVFMLTTKADEAPPDDVSPHALALALLLERESARIAGLEADHGAWWHDTAIREWRVQRPWAPGISDTTHFFTVSYLIDGKAVTQWSVNTRSRQVAREGEPIRIE